MYSLSIFLHSPSCPFSCQCVVLLFSVWEVTEDLRVTSSNPTFSLGFKCFLAADDGDDETDFHCLKFTSVEDQMELTYKLHHMSFI